MRPRAARHAVVFTPAVALLVCAPWHLTRFSPPKIAVAFLGVVLGLLALRRWSPRQSVALAKQDVEHRTALRVCLWAWWGLLAWAAVSLLWSPDPGRGVGLWLLWLLAGLWALVLGRSLSGFSRRNQRLRRHLAWVWLVAAAVAAGLALAQRFGFARLGLSQVTSTLGNPNRVAVVLVLSLPLAVLLATRERLPVLRWLARSLAALLIAGVLATGCRAAVVALVAQALFWCITLRGSRRFRAAAVALLIVSGALVWAQGPPRPGAFGAAAGRVFIARVSARVLAARPVRGAGLGGFPMRAAWAQGEILRERPDLRGHWSHLNDAHNQGLMVGAELGVVGLAALLLLLLPPLWLLLHRHRETWPRHALAAWIGLGLCAVTETPLLSPVVVLLAFGWLVLGVVPVVVPVSQSRAAPPDPTPSSSEPAPVQVPWLRFPARPAALGLALLGLALATSGLLAHYHLGQGLRRLASTSVGGSHLAAAEQCYDRGLAQLGPAAALRFQRALARRELGDLVGAIEDMRHSFGLRPSPDRALFLGDAHLARGDVNAAIPWYRRALGLHPRYQRAYNNLGVALLRAGRRAEACRTLVRARSLLPGDRTSRKNYRAHCLSSTAARRPGTTDSSFLSRVFTDRRPPKK